MELPTITTTNPSSGPLPKLICLQVGPLKGAEFELPPPEVIVGRDEKNSQIVIQDRSVSRRHARFFLEGGTWFIEDLHSSNGIKINQQPIQKHALRDGDEILIGHVAFRFSLGIPKSATSASPVENLEGTLMFSGSEQTMHGGNKAMRVFLDSLRSEQPKEEEAPPLPVTTPGAELPLPSTMPRTSFSKKVACLLVTLVVVILALVVFFRLLPYLRHKAERETAERQAKQTINDFVARQSSLVLKEEDIMEEVERQITKLEEIRNDIASDADRFPDSQTLRNYLARVDFFIFERSLKRLLIEGDLDRAARFITEQTALHFSDCEVEKALIGLAELMISLKQFIHMFPQSPLESKTTPDRREIQRLKNDLDTLKREYVARQQDLICHIWFAQIIKDTLEKDGSLIRLWDRFFTEFQEYESASGERKKNLLRQLQKRYPNLEVLQGLKP